MQEYVERQRHVYDDVSACPRYCPFCMGMIKPVPPEHSFPDADCVYCGAHLVLPAGRFTAAVFNRVFDQWLRLHPDQRRPE